MSRILKNLIPYWKSVVLVIALLIVQAVCDLALPTYTSNIIDTGIQNGGIEHIVPEMITSEEYKRAQITMTESEKKRWVEIYDKVNDSTYKLNVSKEKELDKLDDQFMLALICNSQISSFTEDQFKAMVAQQTGMPAETLANMSIEDIGATSGIELKSFERKIDGEVVNCVDMRPLIKFLINKELMTEENVLQMREAFEGTVDTLGSSLVKSMGIAYAKNAESEAGMDMDAKQTSYLWNAGLKMVGIALIIAIAAVAIGFLASRVAAGVGRDLRVKLYKNVMGFSNSEMEKFSTASLITRTTNDVQQVQLTTVLVLRMILYAPIIGVGGVLKVMGTGAGMGWVIALAVIVILGFVSILMALAMPKFKSMQKLVDNVNLVSREILTGLSVIRAFGRERKEEERFDEANTRLTKTQLFVGRVMSLMMPLMMFIMNGLSVLIVWVAAHRIDDGVMQVGAMTAFITYAMIIVISFLMLAMLSVMLPRAMVAAERIDEVLNTASSIADPENPDKLENVKGVVAFEKVSFKYPDANLDVLEDISFVAEPGKTTAIIGSTGSGKSTLVNLIPRLYDVTGGRVTLDGVDIRDITMEDLRAQIGYVPQKGILFSGTIASNLRFGDEEASDETVKAAAEIAQATDFIEAKSAGYDSPIAQGGTNVSGGQKQRLSIARAIAKNPKIFIFDDSFSALDLKTDAALRKALAEKVSDSTVIIVAQRISTIMNADQILVMDEGKIVGKGYHDELLLNCETYQQIASSQLSTNELNEMMKAAELNVIVRSASPIDDGKEAQ